MDERAGGQIDGTSLIIQQQGRRTYSVGRQAVPVQGNSYLFLLTAHNRGLGRFGNVSEPAT